eukprot:TRINITY_DN26395_c0_g1_i1.p1 TRINITY_DN26395_c0_g1~~TRINITY_DN26395_c0_g1_i1.p1  ORF type:complete len:207 (-),score=53.59 TRINITY_DN26395_c0_g1_i1:822-1442(-)
MNLSLIDLADNDSRTSDSPSLGTRTPTPSPSPYWDSRNFSAAQAADLHSALNNIPKSFSSQLSQYAQFSALPQFSSNPALAYGLPQTASYGSSSKDRNSIPRERDLLSSKAYDNIGSLYTQTVPTGSALSQSQVGAAAQVGGGGGSNLHQSSKYSQLLAVIEEIGKDIRPTYAGSKSSAERLKRGIVHARILVREALMEAERSARQ